jgi:hypothetical protein
MLLALALLPFFQAAQVKDSVDLSKLVATYRHLELPFPPEAAPFVYMAPLARGLRRRAGYYLGAMDSKTAAVLQGAGTKHVPLADIIPLQPVPADTDKMPEICTPFSYTFPQDDDLATAAIEESRGHHAFALKLLETSSGNKWFYALEGFGGADYNPSLQTRLACLALGHWKNSLLLADSNRAVIADHVAKLLHEFPDLAVPAEVTLLHDTQLAVSQRYRGTNPDEQLIDSLCDATEVVDNTTFSPSDYEHNDKREAVDAIADRGFDFVPTLIAHLDDHRLTRAGRKQYMNARPYLFRVCDFCHGLLECYADMPAGWEMSEPDKERTAINVWWERARLQGEKQYAVSSLDASRNGWSTGVLIRLLEKRYPDALSKVYLNILSENRGMDTWPLVTAIVRASIPKEAKVTSLLEGAKQSSYFDVFSALGGLQKVAPDTFEQELIRVLDHLTTREPTLDWNSNKASFAYLVDLSKSTAVWESLAKATKRADPNLKVELMLTACSQNFAPKDVHLITHFLSQFFDDNTRVPHSADAGKQLIGIKEDMRINRVAACYAAGYLGLKTLDERATASDWEQLRHRVEARIGK